MVAALALATVGDRSAERRPPQTQRSGHASRRPSPPWAGGFSFDTLLLGPLACSRTL